MGFLWTEFGILERSFESSDSRYLIIENDQHETRKSPSKIWISYTKTARQDRSPDQASYSDQDKPEYGRMVDQRMVQWPLIIKHGSAWLGGITSDETVDELNRKLKEAEEQIDKERELRVAAIGPKSIKKNTTKLLVRSMNYEQLTKRLNPNTRRFHKKIRMSRWIRKSWMPRR